jgi:hypothetical protein
VTVAPHGVLVGLGIEQGDTEIVAEVSQGSVKVIVSADCIDCLYQIAVCLYSVMMLGIPRHPRYPEWKRVRTASIENSEPQTDRSVLNCRKDWGMLFTAAEGGPFRHLVFGI